MEIISLGFKGKGITNTHRKENHFQEEYLGLVVVGGKILTAINCRFYGTQAKNYCCLWYNNNNNYGSASGSAGGYGYHRPSAAFQEALDNAGIELSSRVDGRGDSAIEDVIKKMLDILYPEATIKEVIKAHP